MTYDLLLKGGHVIDPAAGRDGVADVAFKDGKVAAVAERISEAEAEDVRSAEGFHVVPGLIDLHTHIYWGGTIYGVEPDKLARASGMTTAVDAGSAVGAVRATEKRLKLQPTWSVLHDKDGSALLGRVMPGASVPVVVVLDAQGRVAFRHEGYHPGDDVTVEQVVVALLAEPR